MKAHLRSARIAPKKANLIAKMVRGMPVPAAMTALQHTHKKAARFIEELLRSAVANAEHNDKQQSDKMVIKTIVVNQGTAYRRGMPMARGRMRPFRKFLTHISLELGYADEGPKASKGASKKAASGVQPSASAKGKAQKPKTTADSSSSAS